MSNTSDQTTKQNDKTRLIVGEVGIDTETGIVGKGHSYDNGKTFVVDDTIYGRIYHADDHGKIWKGIQDQVAKVVAPAKSAADSAQSTADAAVASAQVTSDAVTAIASATAEAKQGANNAMSRANSAWNVATGAKEAVTDFDPLIKSAQSDASKALTQIADTASALSDAKTSFGSDVAEAKELANTAQTTANSAVESAGENARALASQANALSDAKAEFGSDVASATGLANAAQSTADNAIKSASSVASDLVAVASQANANASGITKVTSDVGLLQTTVADNSGNISKIQETAAQIQQAVSDNAGNITTAKQTADSAVAVASDAESNATVAVQTASGASVTAKDAQGDATTAITTAQSAVAVASDASSNATIAIQTASQASITAQNASGQAASAVLTANGAMTTASNAESNATVAIQTASGASLTATNAQSDATIAKQTASEATVQASNAESDFAQLSIRANKIEANVATNSGAIASVQQTANGLITTVADIKDNGGGVNLATGTDQEYTMGYGIPNTVWQDGYAYEKLPLNTIPGEILPQDPHTFWYTLTQGTIYTQTIWFETDAKLTNNGTIYITWFTNGVGHDLQPAKLVNLGGNKYKVYSTYTWPGKSDNNVRLFDIEYLGYSFDFSTGTYLKFGKLELEEGTVSHTWSPAPDDLQNQFTQVKASIDGIATTINDPKTGLNATYQTAQGNATTISNVKSDVAQLETTATGITSRVGNLESTSATQQTELDQTKAAIALKADQTDVDTVKGTVAGLQSSLTTQADQIQSKVSASDVTGMLTGYATQAYTQSLVTQKADQWNLDLTSLQTDVNAIKTTGGGVNLVQNTSTDIVVDDTANTGTQGWNFYTLPISADLKVGDKITISVENVTMTGKGDLSQWVAILYSTDISEARSDTYAINSGKNGQATITVTSINDPNKQTALLIYSGRQGDTEGKKAVFHHLMVEEGTVAHTWSPAPSDMATVTSVTNLSATVDGIQAQVYNSDGSSKITQLSNLIATKVSQGDYNSQITQLNNAINQRVQVGDVISQINQEAGGDTLIQVSNGKKTLILDAGNTVFTGEAWIPSAAISSIDADKVMLGSSALYNSDGTLNLVNQNNGLKALIQVKQGLVQGTTQSIISFSSDYNNRAFSVTPVGATITPTLFFEEYDQDPEHFVGFTRHNTPQEGLMFNTWDNDGERFFVGCHARFDRNISVDGSIYLGTWDGTNLKPLAGILSIESGNTIWSGSNFLAIGDHLSNSYTNVIAQSFSQQSTLSSKTNIETVDPKDALDLVNKTDIRSYQYKSDVALGKTKRYTSLIIDDVNDVSQYYAPNEFTNEERTGRDDGSAVGYLFLSIQELTRRIKTLEDKLNG